MMSLKRFITDLFNKKEYSLSSTSPSSHRLTEVKEILSKIIEEARDQSEYSWSYENLRRLDAYSLLKDQNNDFKVLMIFHLTEKIANRWKKRHGGYSMDYSQYAMEKLEKNLLSLLIRSSVKIEEEDLITIAQTFRFSDTDVYQWPYKPLMTRIENHIKTVGLSKAFSKLLKEMTFPTSDYVYAEKKHINKRIKQLLTGKEQPKINNKDVLGKAIYVTLKSSDKKDLLSLHTIIDHALKDKDKSIPTKKWIKQAKGIATDIDRSEFRDFVIPWLTVCIEKLKTIHKRNSIDVFFIHEDNILLLRGLVWLSAYVNDDSINQTVEELGLWCFKKFPGHGALSVKVGNGCLFAFSQLPYEVGISRLTKFRLKIKYPSVRSQIEKLIQKTAEKEGKTIDQIEELAVQNYGLNALNQLECEIGNYMAILRIVKVNKTEIIWQKPDGKIQKSIPASIKASHQPEIDELKKKAKEIQNILPAQRDRIESFFLKKREWTIAEWQKYYHDHRLISFVSRKLIWTFKEGDKQANGIYYNDTFIDAHENPITWLSDQTKVTLWHPIGTSTTAILQWRTLLDQKGIQQPFKQAFREVYLVTAAELETENYSNRFAAHILYQFQFVALCQARRWSYTLMGQWDSHNTPTIKIPAWDMTAEFWVDVNWDGEGIANDMGVFNYIFTDQVRFYDKERQLPMDQVPDIVFSEIMRDVDLFVGVTSIGNDPNWVDGGLERYNGYWHNYSFGELSESSKIRKEVLQNLIPKLKIAKQCSFEDHFLVVEGKRRIYKIHIGSGNILMKPNDRYLCIVPNRKSSADKVLLPFEGDHQLSIILSKAFLLAEDDKIKDRTILSQLGK